MYGMPPMPSYVEMPYGVPSYNMPSYVEMPVYDSSVYEISTPVEVHPPPQTPPTDNAEVLHPDVIASEQRKNVAQARQNLASKTKELTEATEQQKKSIADQA